MICVIQYAFVIKVKYSSRGRRNKHRFASGRIRKVSLGLGFSRFSLAISRVTHARAQVLIKIDALVGSCQIKAGRAAL